MIIDAILARILHTPTPTLLMAAAVTCFLIGLLGCLSISLIMQAFERTPSARARRAKEVPVEAAKKIGELSARVLAGLDREKALREENARLRGLVDEEANHGRNWRARVHEGARQ